MKPLNRALSYMNMPDIIDDDEDSDAGDAPASKKPRLADQIGLKLECPMQVVPTQTVRCLNVKLEDFFVTSNAFQTKT